MNRWFCKKHTDPDETHSWFLEPLELLGINATNSKEVSLFHTEKKEKIIHAVFNK